MKVAQLLLSAVFLSSCGKDEVPKPAVSPAKQESQSQNAADLRKLEGDLPKMNPEEAKFIAVPATPPDPVPNNKAKHPAEAASKFANDDKSKTP